MTQLEITKDAILKMMADPANIQDVKRLSKALGMLYAVEHDETNGPDLFAKAMAHKIMQGDKNPFDGVFENE